MYVDLETVLDIESWVLDTITFTHNIADMVIYG